MTKAAHKNISPNLTHFLQKCADYYLEKFPLLNEIHYLSLKSTHQIKNELSAIYRTFLELELDWIRLTILEKTPKLHPNKKPFIQNAKKLSENLLMQPIAEKHEVLAYYFLIASFTRMMQKQESFNLTNLFQKINKMDASAIFNQAQKTYQQAINASLIYTDDIQIVKDTVLEFILNQMSHEQLQKTHKLIKLPDNYIAKNHALIQSTTKSPMDIELEHNLSNFIIIIAEFLETGTEIALCCLLFFLPLALTEFACIAQDCSQKNDAENDLENTQQSTNTQLEKTLTQQKLEIPLFSATPFKMRLTPTGTSHTEKDKSQ